jgi:PAS domain-containing protein
VDSNDIEDLYRQIKTLEGENARLEALVDADLTRRKRAETALAESEERYRTLFNSIDEGFCIIEFFDGPHGPLSDYVHVEANPAYTQHAGIPNVVGQKVREMVPLEAGGWVELYGGVLRSGVPIRFERELVATGRHLELAAFRVEPASRQQVAVLFQDITARKRAE